MIQKTKDLTISKSNSWRMFDDIAPRYDLLNRILSLGMDQIWRARLAEFMDRQLPLQILDLATGTADVLLSLLNTRPNIEKAIGIDLAENMLKQGKIKICNQGFDTKVLLETGDITHTHFSDDKFDYTTIAFGIRNVEDPHLVLKEMHRVLKINGQALILEFSLPEKNFIRQIDLFYLRNIVPLIGYIFTGHYQAYRYLNQTIEQFPYGQAFCQLMQACGFKDVKAHPLFLGAATIYQGKKV